MSIGLRVIGSGHFLVCVYARASGSLAGGIVGGYSGLGFRVAVF